MIAKFKLYATIAAINLVCIGVVSGYVGYKFYGYGQENVQAKWDKAKLVSADKKLDKKVRLDEIQNAPVDTAVTTRRLHNGTF